MAHRWMQAAAGALALVLMWASPALAQDADQQSEQGAQEAEGEQGAEGEGEQAESESAEQSSSLTRGNRMEFDARLIRGESAGSGAVFLFDRAKRPLPSMIDKRHSFLRGTVDSVLGPRWAEQFDQAQSNASDTD